MAGRRLMKTQEVSVFINVLFAAFLYRDAPGVHTWYDDFTLCADKLQIINRDFHFAFLARCEVMST
jgi:hypothetical protein